MNTGKILIYALSVLFTPAGNMLAQGIFEAAKAGDQGSVKAWLDKDPASATARDDRRCTPLHFASEWGHGDVAELLILRGAEVDARDVNRCTPLHYAATKGRVRLAELLLARGADINAQDKDGMAALHRAAASSHKEMFTLLVERGAKIDLRENRGATPLIMAIWRLGDFNVVRLLSDKGADLNAKIEGSWITPIAMAAQYGHRAIVDFLIDKGVAIDEKSRPLFRFSVAQGLDRLFRILLDKGADLKGATNNGGTWLHSAAEGGSAEIMKTLVEKGFDLAAPDRYGWTPLHYAALNGRRAAVEWLLGNGAPINIRTLSGKSSYNLAMERGDREIAALLAARSAEQGAQMFPALEGEYLGQKKPAEKPELFAIDIVSSPEIEHGSVTCSPDGKTFYWTSSYHESPARGSFKVFSSSLENGRWTPARFAFFTGAPDINDDVPFVSPDGTRLFFMSKRPVTVGGGSDKENYWAIDKTDAGWSEPRIISESLSRMAIRWQISVSGNGALLFGAAEAGGHGGSDLYMARSVAGRYAKPENLGRPINTEFSETAPFIAPDESYIIFGREGTPDRSGDGLHISYKDKDGCWTRPVSMGEAVNAGGAGSPYVSPDGKCFFFNSGRNGNYDIYWVDAKIIDQLRPAELRQQR